MRKECELNSLHLNLNGDIVFLFFNKANRWQQTATAGLCSSVLTFLVASWGEVVTFASVVCLASDKSSATGYIYQLWEDILRSRETLEHVSSSSFHPNSISFYLGLKAEVMWPMALPSFGSVSKNWFKTNIYTDNSGLNSHFLHKLASLLLGEASVEGAWISKYSPMYSHCFCTSLLL